MIIKRIYGNKNLLSLAFFLPGGAKDLSAHLYSFTVISAHLHNNVVVLSLTGNLEKKLSA
jgi:hypothetical protein